MKRNPGENLFLIVVLAALAGAFYVLAPPGLASNEEGVQYVQMKNIVLNGSFEIQAQGLAAGFDAEDLAGPRGLLEARDGRLYAIAPPLFPWAASLFYPVFGEKAVVFAPILFLFLAALVMGLTLDRMMRRNGLYWLLLAAFLFGSPVFMQGLVFTGAALALLLIVSALWLLASHFGGNPSRAKLFLASVLVGASAIVRPECLVIVFSYYLCTAIVLFAQKRLGDLWTVFASGVFCLAALVLHDIFLHGRFPGPYLAMVLPSYALSPIRMAILGGAIGLSAVLLILSRQGGIGPVRKAVTTVLPVIILLGAVVVTAARISVSPLMALFPAVLFVFYGLPERLERLKRGEGTLEGILAGTVVLCLVLGAAILLPDPRIVLSVWLPIVPLVVVLLALERRTLFSAPGMAAVLAFFIGVAIVNGFQESKEQILRYKGYNAARIAFLERHTTAGDAVVFDDAGSLEHAGPLYFERVFLVARGNGDHERLVGRLRERGIDGIYAWTVHPLAIKGFDPYSGQIPPAFPPPPGETSCCSKSCKKKEDYLVRLDARASLPKAPAGEDRDCEFESDGACSRRQRRGRNGRPSCPVSQHALLLPYRGL